MSRYRSGTITVDVNEVINEIQDDHLLDELRARKLIPASEVVITDLLIDAHMWLVRGDVAEARLCLERALFPKYQSEAVCQSRYEALRAAHG